MSTKHTDTSRFPRDIWLLILDQMCRPWRLLIANKTLLSYNSLFRMPIQTCAKTPNGAEIAYWVSKSPDNIELLKTYDNVIIPFKTEDTTINHGLSEEQSSTQYIQRDNLNIPVVTGKGRCILSQEFVALYRIILAHRPCFKYTFYELLETEICRQIEFNKNSFDKMNQIVQVIELFPEIKKKEIRIRCGHILYSHELYPDAQIQLDTFMRQRRRWINGSAGAYFYLATQGFSVKDIFKLGVAIVFVAICLFKQMSN